MTTTTIRIKGMHCGGCADRIRRVLKREPGVRRAEVSHPEGRAVVAHDERTAGADRLAALVEQAGYTADLGAGA